MLIPCRSHIFIQTGEPVHIRIWILITYLVIIGNAGKSDDLLKFVIVSRRQGPPAEIHDICLESPLSAQIHHFLRRYIIGTQ